MTFEDDPSSMHIHEDGTTSWWRNSQIHRTHGPAVIHPDGKHVWVIHGKNVTPEVNTWMTAKNITWPWADDVQMEFTLTWL